MHSDRTVPAYFHYAQTGGVHLAEAALLLPLTLAEAADVLESVEGYPRWALVATDGSPVLRELWFDAPTGRGHVRLDDSEEGLFEGVLTRRRDASARGTRIEMLGGVHIKQAAIEAVALSPAGCPGASVVTVRITWKPGVLARLFAGGMLSVPASFVLAIRDDLAAHLLLRSGSLETLVGAPLRREAGKWVVAGASRSAEGEAPREGEEILRVEPSMLRLGREQKELLERSKDGGPKVQKLSQKEALRFIYGVLSGAHTIAGYELVLGSARESRKLVLKNDPVDVSYGVHLVKIEDGFTLSLTLGPGS
jgi:hypothetical protein